ncbi:ImmA/IrrE family metallo-endopeptidase [Clostridium neonatale]|uniref:ImmA/IrrE family metallo-endopeptidase n=1 Tax=Clostridium neonatale TaxID=137838 RepID=UPI00397DAE76
MISYIQSVVDKIIDEYDNLDPVYIAKNLKRVEFKLLPLTENINGFYEYRSPNRQLIVVNENLCGEKFYLTLFHELSHYFLEHKNTLLLNSSVTMNLKEEYEADLCGTCLYLQYVKQHRSHEDVIYPQRVCELMKYFK